MSILEKLMLFFLFLALMCLFMWFYESCKYGSGAGSPIKGTLTEIIPAEQRSIVTIRTHKLKNKLRDGKGSYEGLWDGKIGYDATPHSTTGYQRFHVTFENTDHYGNNSKQKAELYKEYYTFTNKKQRRNNENE